MKATSTTPNLRINLDHLGKLKSLIEQPKTKKLKVNKVIKIKLSRLKKQIINKKSNF